MSEEARLEAYSKCHKRSAERLLKALLANGGASSLMMVACTQILRNAFSQLRRCIHKIGPAYGVIVSYCLILITLDAQNQQSGLATGMDQHYATITG